MFLAGGITVFGFYGVLDWDEDLTNVSVCPQQLKKQQIGHWFLLSLRENNLDLLAVIFAGCIAPFVLPHLRRHGLAKAAKSMLSWYKQKQKSRPQASTQARERSRVSGSLEATAAVRRYLV